MVTGMRFLRTDVKSWNTLYISWRVDSSGAGFVHFRLRYKRSYCESRAPREKYYPFSTGARCVRL